MLSMEKKKFLDRVNRKFSEGEIITVKDTEYGYVTYKAVVVKDYGRDERRRLEKAIKDKNNSKVIEWMSQVQDQIIRDVEQQYNASYHKEMGDSIDNFIIALAYTLWFSEETVLRSKERLNELLHDLYATIDLYGTHEKNPIDYIEELNTDGIDWFNGIAERRKHEN